MYGPKMAGVKKYAWNHLRGYHHRKWVGVDDVAVSIKKSTSAVKRALKNLEQRGVVEMRKDTEGDVVRLTSLGRRHLKTKA